MPSNYNAIRAENERRYGTDIGRIGPMLLADRYDDRTHFIYELLQNAEDALAKRASWNGKRSVCFQLDETGLRVSHFGKPFDELDVRGICGIAESTKALTAIGRFGIGFKSVYAFTDRPEVYSGGESFAIESFVRPVAVQPVLCASDETLVVLPLHNARDRSEIETGLKRLGAGSLLFLREIEEIEWRVEGGSSGLYLRSQPESLGDSVRRINVIGQSAGQPDVEESWLLFSKPVHMSDGKVAGQIEIAFSIVKDEKSGRQELRRVVRSPLVAFFPTVVETHLGFLVQGPYRTTPSRDNVPALDSWNRHCVVETASVVCQAFRWLRDNDLLDAGALRCLPLERAKFAEGAMFAPVFDAVRKALADEPLLPRHGGGHVAAGYAKLARSQELRDLFGPVQLTALLESREELSWLSGDISQDRTPELRGYLVEQLKIEEVRPETILSKLSVTFLEAQPDEWIRRLYEFLGDLKALLQRARELPLVRLESGKHVRAQANGQPQAFLPGAVATGFPTVRSTVCDTKASRDFLIALGLTEPDLVDDVVVNVLPRYLADAVICDDATYAADIERIVRAYRTDSESRRNRLIAALGEARFIAAREQHDNSLRMAKPSDVYLATERLVALFGGVKHVLIVDTGKPCLKGEDVRGLLEACGALRHLRPVEDVSLTRDERRKLREQAGHAETSGYNDRVTDWILFGVDGLLSAMPNLDAAERSQRAKLLWDELAHLEARRGKGVFTATYSWTHYGSYRAECEVAFVRTLNAKEWVADADSNLQRVEMILFDSLGWTPNPFLLSKIRFKPPVIDQLAREAGIEPCVLVLLKKHGVTSVAELVARLGLEGEARKGDEATGDMQPPALPVGRPSGHEPVPSDGDVGTEYGTGEESGGARPVLADNRDDGRGERRTEEPRQGKTTSPTGSPGGRPFISYLATHPAEEEPDPDGIDRPARMTLEAQAINLILAREPHWHRTPAFNPGFDLFQTGPDAKPNRWCEVKAMTGSLNDRPVGLSRTQFECAREHGNDYWLYVVEHAGAEGARIVRIEDPAGKARTFTFDHGWINVAVIDSETR